MRPVSRKALVGSGPGGDIFGFSGGVVLGGVRHSEKRTSVGGKSKREWGVKRGLRFI